MDDYKQGVKDTLDKIKDLLENGASADEVLGTIDYRLDVELGPLKIGDRVIDEDGDYGYILNATNPHNPECAVVFYDKLANPQIIDKSRLKKAGCRNISIAAFIKNGARELGLLTEPERGTWKHRKIFDNQIDEIECSECHESYITYEKEIMPNGKIRPEWKYCPKCGAKMEACEYEA